MRNTHTSCLYISIAFLLFASGVSASPTIERRDAAANRTAQHDQACTAIQPFYWEIGDKNRAQISGSVGGAKYTAGTTMLIASASKWIWGAYVVQHEHGKLSNADISALNMTSGYASFRYPACSQLSKNNQGVTVNQCFTVKRFMGSNAKFDEDTAGRFFYNGGHFQKQAIELGLGDANNLQLQQAIQQQLGVDISLSYDSPQLASGVSMSATDYAKFLRKILSNQLLMNGALGTHAVCTNPSTCDAAISTPIPSKESWHYSLGHWVEDDAAVGDGAFSSPGAFGFYPWIDRSKTYYGVVARKAGVNDAISSVKCGREIRKAWITGIAQ